MSNKLDLETVYEDNGLAIRRASVPGGHLFITEKWNTGGDSISVASTFVPKEPILVSTAGGNGAPRPPANTDFEETPEERALA